MGITNKFYREQNLVIQFVFEWLANKITLTIAIILIFTGCTSQSPTMEIHYLKDGKLQSKNILLDFIDQNGNIRSPYIDTVKFGFLDSLSFPNNNPDRETIHTTPYKLDFCKTIEPYSPEYYCIYTVYEITRVIKYYNLLFNNEIDFNSQVKYRTIDVMFGDVPLFTSPNSYIFEKNSNPSPSLFAHEIGHRVFWYFEDIQGIKFNGLSVIHCGLLEYFTVSFNNSPVVGEDFLPSKGIRNVEKLYKYPIDSTFNIKNTLRYMKESYPVECQNPQSNISKYLAASYATYNDHILNNVIDNHRGGMVLTSTLWRIREQIGQEKTDKLVAQAIINLNFYMNQRSDFYCSDEMAKKDTIEWYDIYYGLAQEDRKLFEGTDIQIITDEFAKTGYPVEIVKIN